MVPGGEPVHNAHLLYYYKSGDGHKGVPGRSASALQPAVPGREHLTAENCRPETGHRKKQSSPHCAAGRDQGGGGAEFTDEDVHDKDVLVSSAAPCSAPHPAGSHDQAGDHATGSSRGSDVTAPSDTPPGSASEYATAPYHHRRDNEPGPETTLHGREFDYMNRGSPGTSPEPAAGACVRCDDDHHPGADEGGDDQAGTTRHDYHQ